MFPVIPTEALYNKNASLGGEAHEVARIWSIHLGFGKSVQLSNGRCRRFVSFRASRAEIGGATSST
jgi:hypothetical protein